MLIASNFQVFCDNDYMTAIFDRADLPKTMNIDRLYLRSRYCKAYYNSTHVIVRTSLTGCGTVFSKDDQTLYFSNVLSEEGGNSRAVGVITRDYLFKANLICAYPRKRTVGSFSFEPAKQRMFVNLGKCVALAPILEFLSGDCFKRSMFWDFQKLYSKMFNKFGSIMGITRQPKSIK